MTHSSDPGALRWRRRLVLGLALTLALAVGWPRGAMLADAAPATRLAAAPEAQAPGDDQAPASGNPTPDTPAAKSRAAVGDEPDVTITSRGIIVGKGGRGVSVQGLGSDREYDSFEDFVNDAPWLAALIFFAVLMVFLTPLLIVVLFIWYKIRKTRMQNETMLRLAEKGVVPTSEAMESIMGNPGPAPLPPSAAPLYEQARELRKRAAWSDLRKGVMFIAVGLGFIFYSMLTDGEANWLGLTCLFVGAGFCFLWFFEDRHTLPAKRDAGAPPQSSV